MPPSRMLLPMLLTAILTLPSPRARAELPVHGEATPGPWPGFIEEVLGMGLPPYLAGLGLNEAQQNKIFYLLYTEAPAMRNHLKQQYKLRKDIDALITAPGFDERKARQLASELARVQADAIFLQAGTESRIRALLTPAQLSRLDENRGHGPNLREDPSRKTRDRLPQRGCAGGDLKVFSQLYLALHHAGEKNSAPYPLTLSVTGNIPERQINL